MKSNVSILFAIPALIWGSTFFAIKFQLGVVDPTWSVSYRFVLAGALLLVFAKARGLNLAFSSAQHRFIFLQGILLFGLNYWLVYIAEEVLVSALVAVSFSMIIFLNILFGALFLKRKTERKVFIGAIIGVVGTILLFRNELVGLKISDLPLFHLGVCFLSVVIASLGNITSAYNQSKSLPVIQTNAFGMVYGGLFVGLLAMISNKPMIFDLSMSYGSSLLYLAVFGSIIAFGAYLTLIGKVGADRAGYVLMVIPVIAVTLSAIFEHYQLNFYVFLGMTMILGGNIIVLKK